MTSNFTESPLFKFTILLLFGFLFFGALYYTRDLLVPLSFSALLAMLLLPLLKLFRKWKIPNVLAIFLCLLTVLLVISGIITVLSSQVVEITEDLPEIRRQLSKKIATLQSFIQDQTHISPQGQIEYIRSLSETFLSTGTQFLKRVFLGTTGTLATVGIMIIYIFFFLLYREKFKNFILKVTPKKNSNKARVIISDISKVTQNYLTGVLTVMLILAILNSIGLLIIGVDYAVFFAFLAALLNIVPYVGPLLGGLLPFFYSLLMYDSLGPAIAVLVVIIVVQFLENNFLTPNIVGSKVKVNPLATIVALLIGGALWGLSGMILFIPFMGILKIIFDNISSLTPYGYLIGEE